MKVLSYCRINNFNKYRMTRLSEAPVISVQVINSGAAMSGCGGPGVPPIAPAALHRRARPEVAHPAPAR